MPQVTVTLDLSEKEAAYLSTKSPRFLGDLLRSRIFGECSDGVYGRVSLDLYDFMPRVKTLGGGYTVNTQPWTSFVTMVSHAEATSSNLGAGELVKHAMASILHEAYPGLRETEILPRPRLPVLNL